jgi:hypothetical protein
MPSCDFGEGGEEKSYDKPMKYNHEVVLRCMLYHIDQCLITIKLVTPTEFFKA